MRSLIGKQAPKFNATAVINGHEIVQNFSLDRYKGCLLYTSPSPRD